MGNRRLVLTGLLLLALGANAASPRYVIDDEAYLDKVSAAGAKLLAAGKLSSLASLRRQVWTRYVAVALPPSVTQKLAPPDLYDRLRESTLAVGTLFKCPDCDAWHFNSSAGFVVSEGGIVCTCCHVVMAQDEGVKEAYLMAADAQGRVFAVESVLAADTDSDTCLLKIAGPALKPLPLREGIRTGERVYCLSHPGGYHYMFTEGMVARFNLRRDEALDEAGRTNGLLSRPVLFLNVTAEFAPGSSGAPIVDEAGNVVAQVSSIADAGDPEPADKNLPPSPSVPVRFCTATEEILRLARKPASKQEAGSPKAHSKTNTRRDREGQSHKR